MKKTIIAASVLTALTTPVLANDTTQAADADEYISVTANRFATKAEDVLASEVIITREQIELIQAKSVLDVLATVSGVDISKNGDRGQNSSVYVRGNDSAHTLILVNGVRVGSATLGTANLNEIAPELIERIEIVKGPRAALWGSDAIGGVIQIFTRKLEGGEHFASATFGSESYQKFSAGVGIKHGNGFTSISVNHEESDGFDVRDDSETDEDGYSYDSLAVNGEQQLTDSFSVNWLAQVDTGDTEYDSSFGANETEVNNHVWHLGAKIESKLGNYDNVSEFSVGQSRTSNIGFGNGTAKEDGSVFDTRRDQLSWVNSTVFSSDWQASFGVDYIDEQLKGTSDYDQKQRDIYGIFGHTMYSNDKFTYELALRYDDVHDVDSETSYNASIAYQLTDDTRVVVSTGTGFKAPTFNDLYYPLQWGYIGNPDLMSETSENYELTLTSQFDELRVDFNLYQTDVENLIDWSGQDADGNVTPVNVDNVDINGAELGLNYRGFGGVHQFNASYIKAEDQGAEPGEVAQLIRRAKEFYSYQFNAEVANADVYLEWQYKGKRYDSVWGVGKVELDSYQLVNLGVSYPVTKAIKLEAKVNNAFDEEYETANTYFSQGRVVYFGISYQN